MNDILKQIAIQQIHTNAVENWLMGFKAAWIDSGKEDFPLDPIINEIRSLNLELSEIVEKNSEQIPSISKIHDSYVILKIPTNEARLLRYICAKIVWGDNNPNFYQYLSNMFPYNEDEYLQYNMIGNLTVTKDGN